LKDKKVRDGYMEKYGKSLIGGWKKRYFVLVHSFLFYYKGHTDREPKGFIDLTQNNTLGEIVDKKKINCFTITSKFPKLKTYVISASSKDEMHSWMVALDGVVKKAQPPPIQQAAAAQQPMVQQSMVQQQQPMVQQQQPMVQQQQQQQTQQPQEQQQQTLQMHQVPVQDIQMTQQQTVEPPKQEESVIKKVTKEDFYGAWICDVPNSDSPAKLMEAQGVPLMIRKMAERMPFTVKISQPSDVEIKIDMILMKTLSTLFRMDSVKVTKDVEEFGGETSFVGNWHDNNGNTEMVTIIETFKKENSAVETSIRRVLNAGTILETQVLFEKKDGSPPIVMRRQFLRKR